MLCDSVPENQTQNLRLFSYRRCPFAIRVRLVLFERNIEFDVVEEDLKNKSEELLKFHPEGRVPLLIHNGFVVYESSVITEYINDTFDGPNLMPSDSASQALVRMWTTWCNHLFKPEIDRFKYGATPEIIKASQPKISNYLQELEKQLLISPWLVGHSFSLADIHVFPFFRQLERVKPEFHDLKKFKKTYEWFKRICERPSFEQAMRK